MGAIIKAIECFYPKTKLSNQDLANEFPDYDFSKFQSKVGIEYRYIASKNQTALDLAYEACEKLFKRVDRDKIDYILYCTQSPEYFLPTTACVLQDRLNLSKQIGALDFNLGCSGYTYGMSLAKGLIDSGQAKNILLVTAETYSKFLNRNDRSNRAIFGDAATATWISFSEEENMIGEFMFGTDGSGYDKLIVKNGCSKYSYDQNAETKTYGSKNEYTDNDLYMNGPEVFNFTNQVIPKFTQNVLEKNKIEKEGVAQFIFHQANAFMLNFLRKRIKIDKSKFFIDLKEGGNTVSNTIPIALKKYSNSDIFNTNEIIVLMGFGVGLSWCGGVVKISNKL
mgnify:CR=1 FL=1